MTTEELAVKLAETEQRSRSNSHRIDGLEKDFNALNKLATAVEVMVTEQKHQSETMGKIETDVTALGQKVDAIEKKPGRRWDSLVEKTVWAVCAAVIAFLLGRLGL